MKDKLQASKASSPRRSADRALHSDRPARTGPVKRAALLNAEQSSAMRTAASPRDAALVVLMVVGAMRVGEATLLAWEDVQECAITIPGGVTKTGATRSFTLPPAASRLPMADAVARSVPLHEEGLGFPRHRRPASKRPGGPDRHLQVGREGWYRRGEQP